VGNAEILNHGIEVRYLRLPIWMTMKPGSLLYMSNI
jgi:hypothetical protein